MATRFPVVISVLAMTLALLGVWVWWGRGQQQPQRPQGPPRPDASATPASAAASGACDWSRIESTDLRVYIDNLRQVGCPEETVRDIIIAKVCKLYAPKLQREHGAVCGYWQRIRLNSAEADAHFRELLQERNSLLKDLLGVDLNDGSNNSSDPRLSFLSRTKADEFRRLENKYADQAERIVTASDGLMTPEERDALEALRRQKAAEIVSLLTPEEKFEYDLRNSPLAQRLRNELGAFEPSEAEFRAIYQAQTTKQNTEMAAPSGHDSNADDQAFSEEQLKSALGADRYAEYQRSKDSDYQCLLKIADRYNLSRDTAVQVFDIKQRVEAQCAEVMADPQYTSEQKQAWLKTVRDQVGSTVGGILGDKGFSVYHDYAGSWLDKLGR